MGSRYSGVERAGKMTESRRLSSKVEHTWELRDLYYEIGESDKNEDTRPA